MQTTRFIISGKVQHVFFRASAKEKAIELNLTGRVKNLSDGSVEIIATGNEESLKHLEEWCAEGPRRARVDKLVKQTLPLQVFHGFTIDRQED